tara:strand:+ start:355 stop:564 length:210 start_codon:yes stop_codon:yes gene_type:complete
MKNNEKKIKKYIDVINKIQKTRSKNNVNWMNILKIAIKNSPNETIRTMKKINTNDNRISNLFKKLSNEK